MKICPICQTRFKDTTRRCRYCSVDLETISSPSISPKDVITREKGKKAPSIPAWQRNLQELWKTYWYWAYIVCLLLIMSYVGLHLLSQKKDFVAVKKDTQPLTKMEGSGLETSSRFQPVTEPSLAPHAPSSDDASDWFNKAFMLCRIGKCTDNAQKAIEYLDNAIKLKPDYAEAFNNRGNAYFELKQYQKAIENYNEAIRLKPQRAESFNNRGMAFAMLGENKKAIEDYDQAIQLKSYYPEAFNNRGSAYANLNQHQRAIDDYNEAIRLKPESASLYSNRGLAYFNLGQYANAIDNYTEAIRLKPESSDLYKARGNAYLVQGNQNSGCQDLYKACELGECESLENAKSKKTCP